MSNFTTANAFSEACETGKDWEGGASVCHEGATFACQANALADTTTLPVYAEWMRGLLTPVPDGRYVLTAFADDEARGSFFATAQFHGIQSGPREPVAPTGKSAVSDYAYVMQFDGDKISHMTKIWNDAHALRGLGSA